MNKTYHRSSNATVFREHPAAVEMRRASKSHIDFAGRYTRVESVEAGR